MTIFIASAQRKKRGSGLARILTESPHAGYSGMISPSKIPAPITTPGKSPDKKKSRVTAKALFKDPPINTEVCQICQKEGVGEDLKIHWVDCGGGCGRWDHQLCIEEFKEWTYEEVHIY